MNRKGIFFAVDVVLAMTVLIIGIIIIFDAYLETPPYVQPRSLSTSVLSFMASNRMDELNLEYFNQLAAQQKVTEENVLDAMGMFYSYGELETVRNMTIAITNESQIISDPFQFAFFINDTLIYNSTSTSFISPKATLIPAKKVIMGVDKNGSLWGPYLAEVWVWS